jgi:hypothetical protein
MTASIAEAFTWVGATGFLHAREIGTDVNREICVRSDDHVVLSSVFKVFVLVAFVRAVDAGQLTPNGRTTVRTRSWSLYLPTGCRCAIQLGINPNLVRLITAGAVPGPPLTQMPSAAHSP